MGLRREVRACDQAAAPPVTSTQAHTAPGICKSTMVGVLEAAARTSFSPDSPLKTAFQSLLEAFLSQRGAIWRQLQRGAVGTFRGIQAKHNDDGIHRPCQGLCLTEGRQASLGPRLRLGCGFQVSRLPRCLWRPSPATRDAVPWPHGSSMAAKGVFADESGCT